MWLIKYIEKAFVYEDEYKKKIQRLQEINSMLNINKKVEEVIDAGVNMEMDSYSNQKDYER